MSITSRQGEDRRDRILEFVADYWTVHGYAPSVREVARGVGLLHPSGAAYQIGILIEAGALARTPGIPRSLRVVQQAVDE